MKKIAIATLLSAFVAAPAVASDFYAGAKLGQAKYSYSNLTKNNPTAFGVFGGYSFNQNFAVEAEYIDLGNINSATTTNKISAWGLSAVGSYPFNDSFSVFGKLGYARTSLKQGPVAYTANNNSATYGLGGQYNVNQTVGIRFGWDRYKVGDANTNTANANLYSVGAVFKF